MVLKLLDSLSTINKRKLFGYFIGMILITTALLIAGKMKLDPEYYNIYCKTVIGLNLLLIGGNAVEHVTKIFKK